MPGYRRKKRSYSRRRPVRKRLPYKGVRAPTSKKPRKAAKFTRSVELKSKEIQSPQDNNGRFLYITMADPAKCIVVPNLWERMVQGFDDDQMVGRQIAAKWLTMKMLFDFSDMRNEALPYELQVHYGFLRNSLNPLLKVIGPLGPQGAILPTSTATGLLDANGAVLYHTNNIPAEITDGQGGRAHVFYGYQVQPQGRPQLTGKDAFENFVASELNEYIDHPLDDISRKQVSDLKVIKYKPRQSAGAIAGVPPTIYRPSHTCTLKWTFNSKQSYKVCWQCNVDVVNVGAARNDDVWTRVLCPIDMKIPFAIFRSGAGVSQPYNSAPSFIYRQKFWWTDA